MATINQLPNFRPLGIALLVTVIVFMIGAFSADYFKWPLPSTPLEKLTRIANDRVGWTAQAIIFPVAFLATAVLSGLIALNLPDGWPRWLAAAATLLFLAAFLLWLPISAGRLELGAQAAGMIQNYDTAAPPEVMANSSTFWPHTYCILAALALLGAAVALGGVLPAFGWVVTGLTVAGFVLGVFVLHDWPPFMSYVILLALAIGLIRTG